MGSGGSVSYVLQVILQCDFMQTVHSCEPGNLLARVIKPPFDHLSIIQEVSFLKVLFSDLKSHTELLLVYMETIFSLFTEAGTSIYFYI